ncbi:MAG: hypothetical protein GDA56_20050 [Hormoscilla sp. GM7CHS1pb]|nr:hypothetical protein [Hormoscilla sp. GM7CHS1pb]
MLDIIFYPGNGQRPHYVELSEDFYEWLAKSDFSKIGESVQKKIIIDDEEEEVPIVDLELENRRRFRSFFIEEIVGESDRMLTKLGESPSKNEYQAATYKLRKLQELRKCLENPKYRYLQRVV